MQRKLFLDDMRQPQEVYNGLKSKADENTLHPLYADDSSWIILRTYDAFVNYITKNGLSCIDVISFDHDLDWHHYKIENQKDIIYDEMEVKTGYHAAQWLIGYCQNNICRLPQIRIHSLNVEGKKNIGTIIKDFLQDEL